MRQMCGKCLKPIIIERITPAGQEVPKVEMCSCRPATEAKEEKKKSPAPEEKVKIDKEFLKQDNHEQRLWEFSTLLFSKGGYSAKNAVNCAYRFLEVFKSMTR